MDEGSFRTPDGQPVPSVTAAEMREVDRVAVEEIGLALLMMMEHAGRGLAETVHERAPEGPVAVLAGAGGNGGGGLCAARHLANHGREVAVVLDRDPSELEGAPARQWRVLGDAATDRTGDVESAVEAASVVIEALVGYSLAGAPRAPLATLIETCNDHAERVVSLDVPAGVDATTGDRPGVAVDAGAVLTLALPKTGLAGIDAELFVADLGIPARVFERAGIDYASPFTGGGYRQRLISTPR